jgi:iron complex outermembrane receptor protein
MKAAVTVIAAFTVIVNAAWAQENAEVDLERIVVTPHRYEESVEKVSSSVTVVTPGGTESANAQKVVDLLRTVPGVGVRDWYGNGVTASVDIAGFGEQAALNVLVLIDGRRVNDVDLSGVDWSQVPLSQVERIEIVRGGGAAVLYGDTASSGVINIITKKGSGRPKVDVGMEYGSYDMNKQHLSIGGGAREQFSYLFSLSRGSTHGYRNNSFEKNSDYASRLEYDFSDVFSLHFASGFHASSYGMPASINQGVIDQYGRRYSRKGDEHANNKDYYFVFGPQMKLGDAGEVEADFNYRHKNSDSYFLTTPLDTQKNTIETFGAAPKYTYSSSILGRENKFISGLDFYRTIYYSKTLYFSKTAPAYNEMVNQYSSINKNSLAGYLQDEFSLFEALALVGGYRYEMARYALGYHDNDLHGYGQSPNQDTKAKLSAEAFNAGLVYTYKPEGNVFLNLNKSFRFPEVDEFSYLDANWQKQLDTNLRPQSSLNYQLGLRQKVSERLKGSFSFSRMDVKKELYRNAKDFLSWGSWVGKNQNYDKTVHESLEAALETKLSDRVGWSGSYTFTRAFFNSGDYDKNEIPLVPRHKASTGLRFNLGQGLTFNFTGNYVGQRYFLNDQANDYSRLNGYMTADTRLSWSRKDLTATFGINNLFNKRYSEYAGVNVDDGVKFYYPSPERNFTLKLDYKF